MRRAFARRTRYMPFEKRTQQLEGCGQTLLEPGEAVIVETPTGGGFGKIAR